MTLLTVPDERVADVRFDAERLIVDLADGRMIAVPLAWCPRPSTPRRPSAPTGPRRAEASESTGPTSTRISSSDWCAERRLREPENGH